MKPKAKKRDTSSVDITAAERARVNAFAMMYGGKGSQKRVLTLLIQWFSRQLPSVQQAVMGWTPGDMRSEYIAVYRAMADKLEAGGELPPEAANESAVMLVEGRPDPQEFPVGNSSRRKGSGAKSDDGTRQSPSRKEPPR